VSQLRVERLRRDYGGITALKDVTLEVEPGERRAIIGPNGAGKSTLFKLIAGVIAPTSGCVQFDGHDITGLPVHERVNLGLGCTFQRNNLFFDLSVFENVRLAVQHHQGFDARWFRPVGHFRSINEETEAILEHLRLTDQRHQLARNLAYGQQRALEIALALATKPRTLLLDEPTAGMSPAETGEMVKFIQGLPRSLTLLIVEHDMDVVFTLADCITVLHFGEVIAEGTPAEVRANPQVQEIYFGQTDHGMRGAKDENITLASSPMLAVEEIHTYYGDSHILQGLSFEVKKGEIVALLGRNGVGKSTTIKSIIGFVPPCRGRVIFDSSEITGLAPHRTARMGVGLVPQGRGIFPTLTVYENITLAARSDPNGGWTLDRVLTAFPHLAHRLKHRGGQLSGGEQQMLAVARALMTNPKLLLMDEPSEGLAPLVIVEIGRLAAMLRDQGLSILLVEQNLGLALQLADRVYIMNKGQIVYSGSPIDLESNDEVKHQYLGV
jgi:ABC-type branched-subunit amino acid transport system ATPase component